jgi:cellulose synthase/poly-beta-1,6-N-acetylglucosamine synthase-like glycosyltransferase
MPRFFGLSAMPTTLLNSILGAFPDRSVPVRGPDRLAVVSPMYNEERGARRALGSLLCQRPLPDELAVSINGSTDGTYGVVVTTLEAFGFQRLSAGPTPTLPATLERWHRPGHAMAVYVVVYRQQTAKSEAINNLVASGLLRAERVLLVDGDTVFDRGFIAALKRNFYRLRWKDGRAVLEDYAVQSGAVTSFVPPGASRTQRVIAAGRSAEYAFSGVLRRGQVRMPGRGSVWGATRLYTVVGCGFAVRRDQLPMPPDTLTEDHDLTLAVQASPCAVERLTPPELAQRGFRLVVEGEEVPFETAFDREDRIEMRHGGNARYVGDALMHTEDPAHVGGFLRQIERWHGGGIENALKRLFGDASERSMTPNVRFTLVAAQIENLLGLLLLLVLPILLALGVAGAISPKAVARNLALWVGLDLIATALMTFAGFYVQARDRGQRRGSALRRGLGRTVQTWLPFLLLKLANPVSFMAAASRVVPAFVGRWRALRRQPVTRTQGVAWERPTTRAVDPRTLGVAATMVTSLLGIFVGVLTLVPGPSLEQLATQRLLARTPLVDMAQHEALPLVAPPGNLIQPPESGASSAPVPLVKASISMPFDPVVDPPGTVPDSGASTRLPVRVVLSPPHAAAFAVRVPGGVAGASSAGSASIASGSSGPVPLGTGAGVSAYCRPAFVRHPSVTPQPFPGAAANYRPLNHFELLMLGRLAPIEPFVEEAATAYHVPVRFLLQVLINESYLNPLAVGETGDKGLSQMTSDALTLVRAISEDPSSPYYNPHLVDQRFNVFDPDFSICAGAAKLAWAMAKPAVTNQKMAYALYINPVYGLTRNGVINGKLQAPVDAMVRLGPLVDALGSAYHAYRNDPASVAPAERALIGVSTAVAQGTLGLPAAYRQSRAVVTEHGVDDRPLYDAVIQRLFAGTRADAVGPMQASAP